MPFQKMSPLVALVLFLVSVTAASSQITRQTIRSNVSKVGIINPVVLVIYTVIKVSVVKPLVESS